MIVFVYNDKKVHSFKMFTNKTQSLVKNISWFGNISSNKWNKIYSRLVGNVFQTFYLAVWMDGIWIRLLSSKSLRWLSLTALKGRASTTPDEATLSVGSCEGPLTERLHIVGNILDCSVLCAKDCVIRALALPLVGSF